MLPIPAFRHREKCFCDAQEIYVYKLSTEPIGSASPKFSSADKSSTFVHAESSSIALVCPAQGFPLPAFR